MKINFILAHNYPGSITKLTWMYARELAKLDHDVNIYYPSLTDQLDHQIFSGKSRKDGLKIFLPLIFKIILLKILPFRLCMKIIRRPSSWSGIEQFGELKSVNISQYTLWPNNFEIRSADVTIAMQTQLLPAILSLKNHGTIVDSLHLSNFQDDVQNGPWFKHVFTTARHINTPRFAVSQLVMDDAKKRHGIDVSCVIHNGVDVENFNYQPFLSRDDGILMFCDPRPQKGYASGIQVLKILKNKYPHLKFASVGNVTGLDTSIFDTVHGFVKGVEIGRIYGKYKYFFMSSLFEGFPAPPLEAMATGAVCIISRTAGVQEYGVDGENCLLFEPGNISEAILKFTLALEKAKMSQSISNNATKIASNYSWTKSTQKLLSLIHKGSLDGLAQVN